MLQFWKILSFILSNKSINYNLIHFFPFFSIFQNIKFDQIQPLQNIKMSFSNCGAICNKIIYRRERKTIYVLHQVIGSYKKQFQFILSAKFLLSSRLWWRQQTFVISSTIILNGFHRRIKLIHFISKSGLVLRKSVRRNVHMCQMLSPGFVRYALLIN